MGPPNHLGMSPHSLPQLTAVGMAMGAGAAQLSAVLWIHAPTLCAAWFTLRPPVVAVLIAAGHEGACKKPGPQRTPEDMQCPDPLAWSTPAPPRQRGQDSLGPQLTGLHVGCLLHLQPLQLPQARRLCSIHTCSGAGPMV